MALPKIEKKIRKGTPVVGTPPFGQIHAHSTGNRASTAQNEADYAQNKDRNSGFYTHVVGNGRIIQVESVNRGAWDVGGGWNSWSYASVELIESHKTKAAFTKDYKIYVELLRKLAKNAGVPIKVDSGNLGILTHDYCRLHQPHNNTDHVDPYVYLAKWGISKAQFKKDVEKGVSSSSTTTTTKKPANSKPVKNGKVGDKVKVVIALYKDSYGKGKSTAKKGKTGVIKKIGPGSKKYLIENWGWAHPNDIQMVKAKSTSKAKDWSKSYYTSNPKKVKLLKNDGLYAKNDVDFKKGKVGGSYPKGTVFNISSIKKQSNGRPRLVTQSGYLLTANKKYVKKV